MLTTQQIHMSFHGSIDNGDTTIAQLDSSAAIASDRVYFTLDYDDYHKISANKDLILQDFWGFIEQMVASLEAARD